MLQIIQYIIFLLTNIKYKIFERTSQSIFSLIFDLTMIIYNLLLNQLSPLQQMTNIEILNIIDSIPNSYFFGLSAYNVIQKQIINLKTFSKIERYQQKNDFSQCKKWVIEIIQFMPKDRYYQQLKIVINLIEQNQKEIKQKTIINTKKNWRSVIGVAAAAIALFWASEEFL
ncbi:hypothetical protein SS50377_23966 [Spironucleus salmonicida]|uniref:Transmembrane protein n=2 Tax=Spironucleus salmonicida TaxID=348837 RepID=A0A9P8LTD6_9EUKA|nr:hypothetical protein SS50377_23966 [Spironucleus salmonicida]